MVVVVLLVLIDYNNGDCDIEHGGDGQGDDNPDQDLAIATQGYGVGNWYLYNGDTAKAIKIYEQVIGGKHWSAFGFIAAEADLYNLE